MTAGLTRAQIGVTDAMIETFGELVFDLSHNLQVRRGDPVREKDFDAVEAQRAGLGLSDQEISKKTGLTGKQVTLIRNLVERRHIQTDKYHRLNNLGGNKRFRKERFVAPEEIAPMKPNALKLKAAMTYDPDRARYYIEQGYWRDDTFTIWLERNARENPDGSAIESESGSYTHATLLEKVRQTAAGLHKVGVGKGDVVAVQLPNNPEYLICYFAIATLGAVMSTVYMPYRAKETGGLLAHNKAVAIICPAVINDFHSAEAALALKNTLPSLETVIVFGGEVEGCVPLEEVMTADARTMPDNNPAAADPVLLLYTSGTTDSPKGAPLSYHNILSNARLGAPEHEITAADRIISAAPYGHLFGVYNVHLALSVGATNIMLPIFSPPEMGRLIEKFKATALFTAPAHIAACLQTSVFDAHDISSLRLAVLSGSAVPPDLAARFGKEMPDGKVTQLWGMTETQAGLYTRPSSPPDLVQSTAGPPSPGTEVRLMREDETPAAVGEEGELQVRGNLLFPGYFDNPAANKNAFTEDKWFRSGDLATMNDNGYVTITGRIKDVINRGGIKYNPLDVEELLMKHPKISLAAIVPTPDPVLGERACVFVTLAGDQTITLDEICTYLGDNNIVKLKHPEQLEIVDDMPMTATRKIIKGRLEPSN